MRRVVLMAILALALPIAAFANSIAVTNIGGTISQNGSGGLTLSGSTIIHFGNTVGSNLGTLSFSIDGPLATGDLQNGGTFSPGGTFTIAISGGPTYTGTFSSDTWISAITETAASTAHRASANWIGSTASRPEMNDRPFHFASTQPPIRRRGLGVRAEARRLAGARICRWRGTISSRCSVVSHSPSPARG